MFTFAPVASSARSKRTSSPPWSFAVLASGSSDITFVRVRRSTSLCSYQSAGFT